MNLQSTTLNDLCAALTKTNQAAQKIEKVDLSAFSRVLEHKAEDMTATVEAGLTLEAMQKELAKCGQWLPLDPPNAGKLTIGDLLSENATGPRRFGYGTIRDYLIGLTVVLADGRVVKSGGKVVKNVAGYDLQKLFIGARGTVGVIVEATFKLRPIPESQIVIQKQCDSLDAANTAIEAVLESPITPVVLDLHNQGDGKATWQKCKVVLGFEGTKDEVDWQLAKAKELGFIEPANLDYDKAFRADDSSLRKISVLPSKLTETLQQISEVPFVARAGNGVIYYRGGVELPKPKTASHLSKRVKDTFDPKGIFSSFLQ